MSQGTPRARGPRPKRPGQCYAPGCEREGVQWVGALFLCAEHAQRWPQIWGQLQPPPEDT